MNNGQIVTKPDTSYRKTYVLKQQTPMIHFQHGDCGVIIRACEFKPKLDKFLLKKLGNNLSGKENWTLKQTDEDKDKLHALNYKVKITVNGIPRKSNAIEKTIDAHRHGERYFDKEINSMYFGNMVGQKSPNFDEEVRSSYKETIFYNADIYVEIQCFIKDLMTYIDKNISEFLLVTNFGTRQSKGFGCFSLKNDKDPICILQKNHYDFVYCEIKNSSEALDVAAGIYAVMKGGVNRSKQADGTYKQNKYIKGYIQRQYLNEIGKKNTGSDKAFIKSKILPAKPREIEKKSDNYQEYSKYEYVRAILGIPENIKFGMRDNLRKGTVSITENTPNDKDRLQRFQSSIQIVVSGKYVILIMKDTYKNILGKEFVFTDEAGRHRGTIKVPPKFDPNQFLSGFVKYFNQEKEKLSKVNYVPASKVKLEMGREEKK